MTLLLNKKLMQNYVFKSITDIKQAIDLPGETVKYLNMISSYFLRYQWYFIKYPQECSF